MAANFTAWSGSRVYGTLDSRVGALGTILVLHQFSRGNLTLFVKQTHQLCVGGRVGWPLSGWSNALNASGQDSRLQW